MEIIEFRDISKVKTRENIQEIYQNKNKITSLASDWLTAIRNGQTGEAYDIRHRINRIKQDMATRFDVIL